jgi:hypothetical protein
MPNPANANENPTPVPAPVYIKRHSVQGIKFTGISPSDVIDKCTIEDTRTFRKPVIAFDLDKKGLLNKLNKASSTTAKLYFCESNFIIPPGCNVVTTPLATNAVIDPILLKKMLADAVAIPEGAYDLVHTISNIADVLHPCITAPKPTSKKLQITDLGSSMVIVGAKACAYIVYADSSAADYADQLLLFYIDITETAVRKRVNDSYDSVDWSGLVGKYAKPGEAGWCKVFAIPLLRPDNRIFYHIIPHTPDGEQYLFDWIAAAKNCLWVAIDKVDEFIDDWSVNFTLDARIVP